MDSRAPRVGKGAALWLGRLSRAGLLTLLASSGGCASARVADDALPSSTAVADAPSVSEYRIGPLDVLDISAPSVPDLTRTVRVTAAGEISLPLLGVVHAGGRTAFELQQDIDRRLAAYVRSPDVSVFVKEYTSERITVEGEVNQPGIYPIVGKTTLLQAIALARGTSPIARLARVAVFRNIQGQPRAAVFNLDAIRNGKATDPEIFGNDVVEINTSRAKELFRNIVTAVPLVAIFRPY